MLYNSGTYIPVICDNLEEWDRVKGRREVQEGSLCLVTQSCLTLCDPMDCNPPGSSVHGILKARILEWVAISFSKGSSHPRDHYHVSWQVDSLPLCLAWRIPGMGAPGGLSSMGLHRVDATEAT